MSVFRLSSTVQLSGRLDKSFSRLVRLMSVQAGLEAKKLAITKTTTPKAKTPNKDLVFGRTFSDHMLEISWKKETGWAAPTISPYHKLSLDPASVVFHYGVEIFEGMKAYKDKDGKIRMFRPDKNMDRLYNSAARLALPTFDKQEFLKCINELLKVEESWIPNERGYSLYIRPTMISTQETLGVGASDSALLYVICSPVGPYYRTGFAPVKLLADPKYCRAWPGGTGEAKCGGNYAPTILPQQEAAAQGCNQVLWLFGKNHEVTEVGTMNLFVLWVNEKGEKELVTAPLDGTILPGVTRDSVLSLCRKWNEFKVSERIFTMPDIVKAQSEGRLLEMFGAGTACIISPVKEVRYMEKDYSIPLGGPGGLSGELAHRLNDTILGIQYGEIPHEWSVVVK
eukprot:Colp12_sorted_trinity150504_noHs@23158